jgi:hypothetical protein
VKKKQYEELKKQDQAELGVETKRAMHDYEQRDHAAREFVAYVYHGGVPLRAHMLLRVACGLEDPE